MKSNHIVIKPVSSACNIDCTYCYYKKVLINNHAQLMSLATLEIIVKKSFLETQQEVTFSFHGGEPLLAGLEFYNTFFELVEKYNTSHIDVFFTIQTNGLLIDDSWIRLFKKQHILIGVSLDGIQKTHDFYRMNYLNQGTFNAVLNSIHMLQKEGIEFNILTVLTDQVVLNIEDIYRFYRESDFSNLQFIEPMSIKKDGSVEPYLLTNVLYKKFLFTLFELWKTDILNHHDVSIRFFENILNKVKNQEYKIPCFYKGVCTNQNVVEYSGNVYSCDLFVSDHAVLGNINDSSFSELPFKPSHIGFVKDSLNYHETCNACKYFYFCRGGCLKYKIDNKYKYCDAIYDFFDNKLKEFQSLAEFIHFNN